MKVQKDRPVVEKFNPECDYTIPLHNLNEEFYVFIWELPLEYATSIQDLAAKFHARYTDNDYEGYPPPKYRGIYRNPESGKWVISSAWHIGKSDDGSTTKVMFDNINNRIMQFGIYAHRSDIPCKMACITSGDNYRDYCKYIKDAIEMLEIEYGATEREALIPIRQNLHRISDYKPHLQIVDNDDDQ